MVRVEGYRFLAKFRKEKFQVCPSCFMCNIWILIDLTFFLFCFGRMLFWQYQYTPQHLVRLLQITVDGNCDMAVRQAASIHFKNFIAKNWSPHDPRMLRSSVFFNGSVRVFEFV